MTRKQLVTLAKTLLGIGLLLLLLRGDTLGELRRIFSNIGAGHIIGLFAISMALNLVGCLKWRLFLGVGAQVGLGRLFSIYLIGRFFSNFLPTMVGGDVARAYLLGRALGSQSRSAVSVIMERATGLVGLMVVVLVSTALNPGLLARPEIALSILGAAIGCGLLLLAFFRPALGLRLAPRLAKLPGLGRLAPRITAFIEKLVAFRHAHRLLVLGLLYSIGFHLLTCLNVYVACLSIGFHPRLLDVMVITPVILLLTMIPVSPNNIGWWEWCFSMLLIGAGGTANEGLAVALVIRAILLLNSLLGGLLFLRERASREPLPAAPPGAPS